MNLNRLCALETICLDVLGSAGGNGHSAGRTAPNNISSEFFNAAVDEYNLLIGSADVVFATAPTKENAFAQSKLNILQKWIDEGRDLTGLNVAAWELKFK